MLLSEPNFPLHQRSLVSSSFPLQAFSVSQVVNGFCRPFLQARLVIFIFFWHEVIVIIYSTGDAHSHSAQRRFLNEGNPQHQGPGSGHPTAQDDVFRLGFTKGVSMSLPASPLLPRQTYMMPLRPKRSPGTLTQIHTLIFLLFLYFFQKIFLNSPFLKLLIG